MLNLTTKRIKQHNLFVIKLNNLIMYYWIFFHDRFRWMIVTIYLVYRHSYTKRTTWIASYWLHLQAGKNESRPRAKFYLRTANTYLKEFSVIPIVHWSGILRSKYHVASSIPSGNGGTRIPKTARRRHFTMSGHFRMPTWRVLRLYRSLSFICTYQSP